MIVPLSVLEFRDRAEMYFRAKIGIIDGGLQFTYGQFAERTHRLANALRSLGVRKGDRISFPFVQYTSPAGSLLRCNRSGRHVESNHVRLTPSDIGYILNHSASRVVFFHNDFAPLLQATKNQLDSTQSFVIMDGHNLCECLPANFI